MYFKISEVAKDIKRIYKVPNYKQTFEKRKRKTRHTLCCNLRTFELVKLQPGKQNHNG